jgi:hypothetical protein
MGTHTLASALNGALANICAKPQGTTSARRKLRSGAPHPTGARVLRNSVEAGTFEVVLFVPPAKGETDRMLRAARRGLDAGRQLKREARHGLRVLTVTERLLGTLTAASVRVFPRSIHLADATELGWAAVARTLRVLEAVGLRACHA